MKKKFLALVLTLAMVLSLVPVTALATNGTPTPDKATESVTKSQDGVNITKKVVTDKEGNHNLVMEAYVEGTTTETTTSTPLDIVLVLDVSGSMDDSQGWGTAKKIESLKSAVNNFIAEVAKKNTDTDGNTVGHRISIVKFAGKKATEEGNDTYRENGYTYNYSQIVKNLITVDATGKNELTAAVNDLRPAGATRADYGMELAQSVLPSNEDSNRDKVVVMFTDGTPTSGDTFENKVASAAISASKALKDKEVKVYTVGIFNNANPKADVNSIWTYKENKYMHAVSSNYPGATFQKESGIYNWSFGERAQGSNYYLSATDADGLNKVFQEISDSITHTTVMADENAVLRDTLMDQFVLNGAGESAITVQTAAVTGKDEDGEYTWGEPASVNVEKTIDGKTVTVKGFNYTSEDNVITEKDRKYSGHKLIVTIPIKVDDTYTGWLADKHYYKTNDIERNKAGLTGYTKNGEEASTLLDTSPQVPVTAYTVKYDWGTSAPAGANIPMNSNTYLTGKTYPVDTTYAKGKEITDSDGGTWHFSGWTDPNNGVMGTKNVTINGSWKYTEPTPSAPTYTLTYDANGGKADSVPTDSKDYTSGETATLNYDTKPTHDQENGKDVIFIGWSATPDTTIYDKGSTINTSSLIQSIQMDSNKTVYAVWGLDKDGDNTPDVFQATVTYTIENGYWFDAETGKSVSKDPVTAQFTLYEKSGNQWVAKNPTLGNTIPTGQGGDEGYTADGWYKDSKKIDISKTTPVTGDVTYTFKYVKVSTEATWDVSRSKIASDLTKNSNGEWTTDVTLSLPSAEEELATDVVFVLDKSTSATLEQQALDMLTKLKEQAGSTKAKVKVGVVIFNKQANVTPLTDLATGYDTIEQAIKQEIKKGTNTHAGLLAGKQMLDGDTEVSANRKYLIFVSDGISYMYDSDGKVVPYYWRSDTPYTSYDPYSWSFKYGDDNPPADWSAWVTQIGDIIKTENVTPILYAEHKAAVDNKTLDISQYTDVTDFATNQYTTCVDRALYYTYQTYTAAKNEGYNCYAVVNGSSTTYPWGPDFMNYLADGKTVNFDKIQNDILYAVSAGSTVIDTIGEKFTFGGVDSFTLKVGTKEIKGVKDASDANTVNFGEQKSNGKYQYTVTYIPDTKTFAWTINENVSNFAPVQLTYTVKLTKPETAAATYGQTDLDGDTFIDGTQTKVDTGKALYTNQSATLVPMNSAGKLGQPLRFPMPSVSYTIKGSSGGHGGNGGGTVTIPDDVPTGLNGKDHYAYVVGYPDGMVYPQKNITRAEVATIFFRLLTDETREANMTKSNSYNDMKDGAWYTCAVSTLSKMGIIKGYEDGSFKPDASISRAEFAAIAARFDPDGDKTPATFSDVSSHWAKDEISIAANHGWIKGYEDGSFKPDQKITRAETMTLVNRVLKRLPETKDDLHKDMKTWPDNQNESAWFYLAVQEATNSHYQKLKKDGTHEKWESMRETRDWAALEK